MHGYRWDSDMPHGELFKIAFTASLMNYERANNINKKNLIGINILFNDR